MSGRRIAFLLPLLLAACSSSAPPATDAGDGAPAERPPSAESSTPVDAREAGASDAKPLCLLGTSRCVDEQQQQICKEVAGKLALVNESCPAGTRCLDAACSAECLDQCNLGETRSAAGKTETCKLYSVAKNGAVSLSKGLHDRARQYNAWLRKQNLPAGLVGTAHFTDTSYTALLSWDGSADSALWSGSYLAAEALRLLATGAPEAEINVEKMVESVHRLFAVTGLPGYLARFTAPLGEDARLDALYNPAADDHHKVTFEGKQYFWKGSTSRDQYQGVMLGYALAYQALSSAKHKQLIRDDVVALCTELMKERKGVKVTVRFNLGGTWFELPVSYDVQYAVPNPLEYKNGGPYIQVGTDDNPLDFDATDLSGMREFLPDWAVVLKQTPLLGSVVPAIPRSGSAIMLAAILRIGMLATEADPALASVHQAIKDHYDKNVAWYLSIMKQYSFLNASQCWKKYYGLNIDYQPIYNLVRLEPDPALRTSFQKDVLEGKMWPYVKDHKNVFFTFIHASQATPGPALQGVIDAAVLQLGQFPSPPHAAVSVDNTGKPQYPLNPSCPGQSTVAIDVADRVPSDFIWQRQPFGLTGGGDPKQVYPGVDYLLAYWLGRRHGFVQDDAKGTCLRWLP